MNAVILGYGVVGKGIEILTNSLDDISIKYVYVRKEKENLPYFSNNEDMVVQDDIDIVFDFFALYFLLVIYFFKFRPQFVNFFKYR